MTGCLRVKDDVLFTTIAPGGFRILSALDQAALTLDLDLTITSACDCAHSGPDDPHHRGEAYDVRTHDHTREDVQRILRMVMDDLARSPRDEPTRVDAGLKTMNFYGFLEAPGTDNEHLHFQVRKGTEYP